MAEQDLIRFLNKISQLQSLAERVQQDSSCREQLASCADHNQVVALAQSWGFEIGRRWGEGDHLPGGDDNLLATCCPQAGEESTRVLASAETWRLVLIASNNYRSPLSEWIDQADHEWVLVLRGSACVALQSPDRIVDLSPGDHLLLSPHQRHRIERTDGDPGTLWLALHWDGHAIPTMGRSDPKRNEQDS